MTIEHFPGGSYSEKMVHTVDDNGEKIQIPISEIPNVKFSPYGWQDSAVVTFDDKGDQDE